MTRIADPGALRAANLGDAGRGERGDLRGAEQRAGLEHGLAGADVAPAVTNVRARREPALERRSPRRSRRRARSARPRPRPSGTEPPVEIRTARPVSSGPLERPPRRGLADHGKRHGRRLGVGRAERRTRPWRSSGTAGGRPRRDAARRARARPRARSAPAPPRADAHARGSRRCASATEIRSAMPLASRSATNRLTPWRTPAEAAAAAPAEAAEVRRRNGRGRRKDRWRRRGRRRWRRGGGAAVVVGAVVVDSVVVGRRRGVAPSRSRPRSRTGPRRPPSRRGSPGTPSRGPRSLASASDMKRFQIVGRERAARDADPVHVRHLDLRVRVADPDRRGEVRRVADEPRVGEVVGRPGLPGGGPAEVGARARPAEHVRARGSSSPRRRHRPRTRACASPCPSPPRRRSCPFARTTLRIAIGSE